MSECGKMDSGSNSFSCIFFLCGLCRDLLDSSPHSRETRAHVLRLNWRFTETKKQQRQSRTRYEIEKKKMNDRPTWRLIVRYSSFPSPIMLHACAWWRENNRAAHCPTSLLILSFLLLLLLKTVHVCSAWPADWYVQDSFGQAQRVICFILKTNVCRYFSHRTHHSFFFPILICFAEYVHPVACVLQIKPFRDFWLWGGSVLFLTSTDNSFPLYPTFHGHSPQHTLLFLPTHPSLVELSPFCTRSVPIKADSPSAACPANTSQR